MIGTGLNIIRRDDIRKMLFSRIKDNCHIEIYAANPFSPNVEARLIEEENRRPTNKAIDPQARLDRVA